MGILENTSILKVGKNVNGDIAKLCRDFNIYGTKTSSGLTILSKEQFKKHRKSRRWPQGDQSRCIILRGHKLGAFCKKRFGADLPKGTADLQTLCAVVLGLHLPKDDAIRCSQWSSGTLESAQVDYALLDALISRDIYMSAAKISLSAYDTGSLIAILSLNHGEAIALAEVVSTVNTAATVNVTEILVPGAILSLNKQRKTLSELGSIPFKVILPFHRITARSALPPHRPVSC